MTDDLPVPPRRCPGCGGGHYAAVPFCPFCGAPQDFPRAEPPLAAPRHGPVAAPELATAPEPASAPGPVPRAASPVPPVAPLPRLAPPRQVSPQQIPPRQIPPRPSSPARRPAPPRRFGLRQGVLAACAIAGLTALALNRGGPEAPKPVRVGPTWTAVALAPFRDAPLLRLTGDGAFSLRLDGERVLRAAPAEGATVRPRELRSLELRAGRGEVTVTLTPRGR